MFIWCFTPVRFYFEYSNIRCVGLNLIWPSITTSVAYIDVTTGGIAELAGDWATFSWARHCFSQPLVDV